MTQFSANLGFLWTDRPLPHAIEAAKVGGFDAVECHWPYEIPTSEIGTALRNSDLEMLGINTRRGNVENGDSGLSALPNKTGEARAAIDEAIEYATAIGALNIHVMAGLASGTAAHNTFVENLTYACEQSRNHDLTILIEPLNEFDAPGYFLQNTNQAADIIQTVGATNLKLMFDCYHVGRTEGNVITRLKTLFPLIGHIQFAAVPDRGVPDHGDVDYLSVFSKIKDLGWSHPLGAEYKPPGDTDASLAWMSSLR